MSRLAARYHRYRILFIAPAACLGLWATCDTDNSVAQERSPSRAIRAAADGLAKATSGFRVGKRKPSLPQFAQADSSVVTASANEDAEHSVLVDERVFAESQMRTASFAVLQPRLGGPSSKVTNAAARQPVSKKAVAAKQESLRPIKPVNPINPLKPVATTPASTVETDSPASMPAKSSVAKMPLAPSPVSEASQNVAAGKRTVSKDAAGIDSILIRPPFVQPYYPDRYTFMVENTGDENFADFTVTLSADDAVAIVETSPERNGTTAAHVAEITIDRLDAGKSRMIDVQVKHESDQAVNFSATLSRVQTVQVDFQLPDSDAISQPAAKRLVERAQAVATQATATEAIATEAIATQTKNSEQVAAAPKRDQEVALPATEALPVGYAISTSLVNPVSVIRGAEAEYGIEVTNEASQPAVDVIVQLKIPAGLKVTVLDRNAWIDSEKQTVSWKVDSMEPGEAEFIRYKAVASTMGSKSQLVTVGMQNVFQGQTASSTKVTADRMANRQIDSRSIR